MDICAVIQGTIYKLTKYKEIIEKASDKTSVLAVLDELKNNDVFSKKVYDLGNKEEYKKLSCLLKTTKNNGGIYLFEFKEGTSPKTKQNINKLFSMKKLSETEKGEKSLSETNNVENTQYLYIGKNNENILSRIKQHLEITNSNKTYAMNLGLFKNEEIRDHLELIIYFLEETADYPEKFILSLLKKELHEKYDPMIGGSRT